jgi:hypothetical protein
MPEGPIAVLRAVSHLEGVSKSGHVTWGKTEPANADQRLAELAAHVATRDGGLHVLPPHAVADELRAAELDPTLQPGPAALLDNVKALGCACYLTATVHRWHESYVFFWLSATIEFDLACYVPGRAEPVWRVCARNRQRGGTQDSVALDALRAAFRGLKQAGGPKEWCICSP